MDEITMKFIEEFRLQQAKIVRRKRLMPFVLVTTALFLFLTAFIIYSNQISSEEPTEPMNSVVDDASNIDTKENMTTTTAKTTSATAASSMSKTTTATSVKTTTTAATTSVTTTPTLTTTDTTTATTQGISVKQEYKDGVFVKVGDCVNALDFLDVRNSEKVTYLVDSDLYIRIDESGNITAIDVGNATVAVLQNGCIESILRITVE